MECLYGEDLTNIEHRDEFCCPQICERGPRTLGETTGIQMYLGMEDDGEPVLKRPCCYTLFNTRRHI